MGLLDVSIDKEDRPRIDRLTFLLERVLGLVENIVQHKDLVIKISLDNKVLTDDIRKS